MKKLISMKDFVLNENRLKEDSDTAIFKITNYAKFINQDLNIGMFVPALFENGEWVVLEEPEKYEDWLDYKGRYEYSAFYSDKCKKFQQAKENVLFAGFELLRFARHYTLSSNEISFSISKNFKFSISQIELNKIEDLIKHEIPLTENAIKLLGL